MLELLNQTGYLLIFLNYDTIQKPQASIIPHFVTDNANKKVIPLI